MHVEYIDHLGSDLSVVNAARVSFDKWHDKLTENDIKLITYLAKHNHFTPFAHPQITLRVTVPFFVARQLDKHQVGLVKNEVSRRYVDTEPEFYIADKLGARAENKKQGAKEDEYIARVFHPSDIMHEIKHLLYNKFEKDLIYYKLLLKNGVAPEDARMVLPLATYTSWIWTGSLAAYARVYNLRSKPDAQRQTREVVEMISGIIEPLFQHSWSALTKGDFSNG